MDTTGIDAPPPENEPLVVVGTEGAESPPELEPRPRRIGLAVTAAVAVIAALAIPSILLTQDDAPPTDTTIDVTTTIAAPTTTVSTTTSPSTTTTTEALGALEVEGFELLESGLPIAGLQEVLPLDDGFVGIGKRDHRPYYSPDGVIWAETATEGNHWRGFDTSANSVILYGDLLRSTPTAPTGGVGIHSSRDGISWTVTTSDDEHWEYGPVRSSQWSVWPDDAVALPNGSFLVGAGQVSGEPGNRSHRLLVLWSSDGEDWEATLEMGVTRRAVEYAERDSCWLDLVDTDLYVLAIARCNPDRAQAGYPAIWRSDDGREWTETALPSPDVYSTRFVASGNRVIAVSEESISSTSDGFQWDTIELEDAFETFVADGDPSFFGTTYVSAGDRFFALTAYDWLATAVATSTDGISWTGSLLGTADEVAAVVADMLCEHAPETTEPYVYWWGCDQRSRFGIDSSRREMHFAGDRYFLISDMHVIRGAGPWPWWNRDTCDRDQSGPSATFDLTVPVVWHSTDLDTWEPIPDTTPLIRCGGASVPAAVIADGDSYLFIGDGVWRWTPPE